MKDKVSNGCGLIRSGDARSQRESAREMLPHESLSLFSSGFPRKSNLLCLRTVYQSEVYVIGKRMDFG